MFQFKISYFVRTPTALVVAVGLALAFAVNLGQSPNASAAEKVKIGVINESTPAKEPWSAAMVEALDRLQAEDPDIEFSISTKAFQPTVAEPIARQLIADGARVMLMHSFVLNDITHKLAKEFPKVLFSVSSFVPPVQPNLSIATASYLQIGYSQCWLLAKISKSGKVGFLAAQKVPYATELEEGCKIGHKAGDPKSTLVSAWSNSFTDQQATREQAQSLIDQGVDGIFAASGTDDALGAFQLCEQRKVPCIGWGSDSRRYSKNYAVQSAIIDWTVLVKSLVAQVRSGNYNATTFDATYTNGGLIPQPIEGPTGKLIPGPIQAEFKTMMADLAAGRIKLPKSKAHPCCP